MINQNLGKKPGEKFVLIKKGTLVPFFFVNFKLCIDNLMIL